MAINLGTKFLPYVDEKFSTESKKSLLTNQDFDWTGAHTQIADIRDVYYETGTNRNQDKCRN